MPEPDAGYWLTGREVAGLPGAPGKHYDVSRWAYRHGIARRGRRGRGGGYEYNVGTMPEETQKALQSAHIYDECFSGDGAATEPPAINVLSEDAVTAARLDILAALSRWESSDYPTLSEARRRFVAAYCRREAGVTDGTYASIPDISVRSLYRWRKDLGGKEAQGCAGKPSGLAPHIMDEVLAQLYAGGSSATITNIHAALKPRAAAMRRRACVRSSARYASGGSGISRRRPTSTAPKNGARSIRSPSGVSTRASKESIRYGSLTLR